MDKIIPIWKPINISSFDIIREIKKKKLFNKIGHCGTLDPFAEGLLIVCTDNYTKKVENIMNEKKKYIAVIKFGSETNTLDLTGEVIKKKPIIKKNMTIDNIKRVLDKFVGDSIQIPPYYSAKKVFGVKMYSLARKNIFVRRKGFPITIYNILFNEYKNNRLKITVECGKGTYIRALGRDIANELGTYGYIENLKRIKIGNYSQKNCINYKDIKNCQNFQYIN